MAGNLVGRELIANPLAKLFGCCARAERDGGHDELTAQLLNLLGIPRLYDQRRHDQDGGRANVAPPERSTPGCGALLLADGVGKARRGGAARVSGRSRPARPTLSYLASCKGLPSVDWEHKAGALTHGGVHGKGERSESSDEQSPG